MGYPAVIQPLVIEDEPDIKITYDTIFGILAKRYPLAPTCYAFCHDDAIARLDSAQMFHVVVLDLKLPKSVGVPALDDIDLGQDLLTKCLQRDAYPIPALMIVSGLVGRTDQEQLRSMVDSGFAHGRVLVKGEFAGLLDAIEMGVQASLRYCAVGIHLKDAGAQRFPTITPREDDLMRRVILDRVGTVGFDLEWWSADSSQASKSSPVEWTKVLMGRILLDGGDRPSRANFLKFMPATRGKAVIETTQRLEHKLGHIKVNGTGMSETSALLVTEKVGQSDSRPLSVGDFLGTMYEDPATFARVATQIISQIEALGNRGPETKARSDFLWRCHDLERITAAWGKYGGIGLAEILGFAVDVPALFKTLSEDAGTVRFVQQTFLHGDLHIGNISLDTGAGSIDAHIFDAGGTESSIAVRDIAALEVSALLHQEFAEAEFIEACRLLYGTDGLVPLDCLESGELLIRNTYELVRQMRIAINGKESAALVALTILDQCLIQLGGLTFGTAESKIRSPRLAAVLTAFAAAWYLKLTIG
jgi:CheY-like chemotaxis protein